MKAKLVKENLENEDWDDEYNEEESEIDLSEISWKMDKFMPDDEDSQDEYYDILAGGSGGFIRDGNVKKSTQLGKKQLGDIIDEITDFLENNANDRLYDYLGSRDVKELATYIVNSHYSNL